MKLNKDYKLERLDSRNVALFQYSKIGKKTRWRPIKYWGDWYTAIKSSIEHLTLGKIDGAGDLSQLSEELSQAMNTVARIAERLSREHPETAR